MDNKMILKTRSAPNYFVVHHFVISLCREAALV